MAKETKKKRRERLKKAHERSTCPTGKIQYRSEKDANAVLLKAWREGNTLLNRAYHCDKCDGYHLTKL